MLIKKILRSFTSWLKVGESYCDNNVEICASNPNGVGYALHI